MPTKAEKRFLGDFVLDKAKLNRMLGIIEQRYKARGWGFQTDFDVKLKNGREFNSSNVEDVFQLDNSVTNPVTRLIVECKAPIEDKRELGASSLLVFDGVGRAKIHLITESDSAKEANQLFAELEEQVERTLVSSLFHKFFGSNTGSSISWAFLFAVVVGLFTLLSLLSRSGQNVLPVLTNQDARALLDQSKDIKNLEDKIDFIFNLQKRQLAAGVENQSNSPLDSLRGVSTYRWALILLPILIIVGCLVYAVNSAYPEAVFLWGDYEQHYEQLVTRRRNIWLAVVVSLLLGIIGNLFVFSITPYLK